MATFYNQATLRYNNTVTTSNVASGELVEVLAVTKTAVRDTYQVGEDVTYVVSILNSGTAPFNGLTVTDDLGAYTVGTATVTPLTYAEGSVQYFVDGVLQPAPAVVAGPPLQISGISVPAGGNVILLYEAQVNAFASPVVGGTVDNTVTVSGLGVTPVTATETVTARQEAQLTVNKAITPAVVTDNSRVTYVLTLQNTGNTAVIATDDAVITDTFDPILTDLVVTFNGTALTAGTDYTYDETTGAFTTLPGVITVPAAAYVQDPVTGEWTVTPGSSTLTIVGTI